MKIDYVRFGGSNAMYNENSDIWKPINFVIANSESTSVPTADQIYNAFDPPISTSKEITVDTEWSPSTSSKAAINEEYMRYCI